MTQLWSCPYLQAEDEYLMPVTAELPGVEQILQHTTVCLRHQAFMQSNATHRLDPVFRIVAGRHENGIQRRRRTPKFLFPPRHGDGFFRRRTRISQLPQSNSNS